MFQLGTTKAYHKSKLYVQRSGTHDDISEALENDIKGQIKLGGRGWLSFWEGILTGRIAIIQGAVSETITISNEQIGSLPVEVDGDQVTILFYTEDWFDYDYNDSYLIVTIRKQQQMIVLLPKPMIK